MSEIILITGGQRSGKSEEAERLALAMSDHPVYMATAHSWDDEFRQRIAMHQQRRGSAWTNIEEEKWLSRHDVQGRVVVVDCITLWCTNFFFNAEDSQEQPTVDEALEAVKREFDLLTAQDATFIFVTNEIGSGGVSASGVQRRFTDLEGWMNQYVASRADKVILMVSGIPMIIKESHKSPPPVSPKGGSSNDLGGGLSVSRADNAPLRSKIQAKIDNLNKPKGSLGRLEELAMQICLVQETLSPELRHPCHLLFGGDHGIECEGVSISPREVTWQQMINFTRGGGGVNMFCRQHGFRLMIVDMGVDYDLSPYYTDSPSSPGIINRKVARGTRNFLHEPAMSREELTTAMQSGADLVSLCHDEGCNIVCLGEMGIGNTSPSSIWMHLMGGVPLDESIGAGAGLGHAGVEHKKAVLARAVEHFKNIYSGKQTTDGRPLSEDIETIIRFFGGFEMVGAIGAMLRAAELKMLVLVDGFIMTACALAATKLCPAALDYMIFGHCGDESGHARMLALMNAKPILHLGMRLGEGTGALCAYPVVDSAVRMMNEMNNFDNAKITKYF